MHKLQASKKIKIFLNINPQAEETEQTIHEAKWSWAHYRPQCFCRPRSSPQQGRDPTHFYLWQSSAERMHAQISKKTAFEEIFQRKFLYLALHLLCPARIMSVDGCDSSLRMWWNNLKLPLSDASLVQRTSFEFSQHDVSCYMQLLFSQTHPQVNIISTHSHDPLHRLQLQRVFVTVQHLLQVIMSEGGKHRKLALTFPVFFFFLSRLITEASKKKCRLVFYAQNWLEAARVTQKLFSLK